MSYGIVTTLLVVATAYSPGDPTQGTGWQTSTGRSAKLPGVAVDPRVIPYGSRVHVPGIGWVLADDCGGAIRGNRIDIRMQSKAKCLEWGRRAVTVTVRTYTGQTSRGRRTLPEITTVLEPVHLGPVPVNPHSIRASMQVDRPQVGGRLYSALLGAVLGLCLGGAVILGILGRVRI